MSKVLVFFAEGFEEIEALTSVDLLRRAQIPVDMVSVTGDKRVTGSHGICIETDCRLDEADIAGATVLMLPGGMPGTRNLEDCAALMEIFDGFYEATGKGEDKYIAAICAAPTIFAHRGYLEGRCACCYPSMEFHLKEGGAKVLSDTVVKDGRIITSRGMGTAMDLGLKLIEVLKGVEESRRIAESVVFY